MNLSDLLNSAIDATEKSPFVDWNDKSWKELVSKDAEYSLYMNNEPIDNQDNKLCHGYFSLLHNIVSRLSETANICELGNREGLSTLAILDALKPAQTFVTVDIIQDLRFLPPEKAHKLIDSNQLHLLIGDCLHPQMTSAISEITNKKVDLLFCDTIHTYEQVRKEFMAYKDLLSNEAIILVDDIRNYERTRDTRTKFRFYEEWEGEKHDLTELCHVGTGFAAFIFRRSNNEK